MIKVGIIGATGYAGVELVRLLLQHPKVEITALGSVSYTGRRLEEVYPGLSGQVTFPLVSPEQVVADSDCVFASLPHGHSEAFAKLAVEQNKKMIDLGADFRLQNEETYQTWYDTSFEHPELHGGVPYGLPELFREEIYGSKLVANPGCYPTGAALGLAPFMVEGPSPKMVLIDAKSGVTGAGRNPSATTHFPYCNENLQPYNVGTHRHTPEIEQTIEKLSGRFTPITFVPHLVPVNRGILSTIYLMPAEDISLTEIFYKYLTYYENEPFVHILPLGETASLSQVTCSNNCAISLHKDERTGQVIIITAIDNMVKGAAGQAIQNMNILYNISETTGLTMAPVLF